MTAFSVGDELRCISDGGNVWLTVGKVYACVGANAVMVYVLADDGKVRDYSPDYFAIADDAEKQAEADEEYLRLAIAWCRKEYKRRRQTEHCHCSHTAKDVLQECENVFPDLRMFGVEGFCDETGKYGITYLNTGDSYGRTILFKSGPNGGTWSLGDWGSIVETQAGSRYVW